MTISRGLVRVFLLVVIISLVASPGMARPDLQPADIPVVMRLPIILKKSTFGNGTVTGYVINAALPGVNVAGAVVCWETICDTSDVNGEYKLKNVASGYQTLTASADGFVTLDQVTYVVAKTVDEQNIAIVPEVFNSGLEYRILATWDPRPCWPDPNGVDCWDNDLDVHLWLEPAPLNYHIGYYSHYNPQDGNIESWLDRGDCYGLFPNACLERDAQFGYGPETIAIKQLQSNTIYYFGVRNFTQGNPGVPPIGQTSATVRLYDLTGLDRTYHVPTNMGDQEFWYVFEIDHTVEPPIITDTNCITSYNDNPPVCP